MRLIYTFLLLIGLVSNTQAQIKLSASQLDYGKVNVWSNDTLTFKIFNQSNESARWLPTYNPRVQIIGPQVILPGQSAEYAVIAYPRVKGYFEFEPTLFFSNSNQAYTIKVKGLIKKFDDDALFQCPKLENEPIKVKEKYIRIEIRDSLTNKVIYHASSSLFNPMNTLDFDGGVNRIYTLYGAYQLKSSAEGYLTKTTRFDFDANNKLWIQYLVPYLVDEDSEEEFEYEQTSKETITLDGIEKENKREKELVTIHEEKQHKKQLIMDSILLKEDEAIEKRAEVVVQQDTFNIEDKKVKEDPIHRVGNEYMNGDQLPLHIIVLADVSFSMRRGGYLDDLKDALKLTLQYLRPQDSLTIITFSTSNIVLADHIGASQKDSINLAIEKIIARGGTNAKIALRSGYGVAHRYRSETSRTRLLLFTDGQFNTPGTSRNWYTQFVKENYLPKGYQLDILLFSKRQSDYDFLTPISSASSGKTYFLDEDVATFLLQLISK